MNSNNLTTAQIPAGSQVFLIDGSSFIYRGYHQAEHMDAKYNFRGSDGLPTGGVRMFLTKMMQLAEGGAAGVRPTHIVVALDRSRSGWRRDLFSAYKANRSDPPPTLVPQFPYMRHALTALGFAHLDLDQYEADDIIATYTKQALAAGAEVTILSADKDLMQLVGPGVRFYDFESGAPGKAGYRAERLYDAETVKERWDGLGASQIGDALALVGDKSDNIPGIEGIGKKTAADLLSQFGNLDSLLARAHEIKQPKRRESVMSNIEQIKLSRRLVALDENAPVNVPLSEYESVPFDPVQVMAFAKAMEFPAVIKRLQKNYKVDPNKVPADQSLVAIPASTEAVGRPQVAAIDASKFVVLTRLQDVAAVLRASRQTGVLGLEVLTSDTGGLLGIGLAVAPGKAAYVGFNHEETGGLFGGRYDGQPEAAPAISMLAEIFADPAVKKIGFGVKDGWKSLFRAGISLRNFDDVQLMTFVLDNGRTNQAFDAQAVRRLGHQPILLESVIGSGRGKKTFTALKPAQVASYAAERAEICLRLYAEQAPRMVGNYQRVYEDIDRPLVSVLSKMEARGIRVDIKHLEALSADFGGRMADIEGRVHALAGEPFQISSPKQVGEVLFDRMGLPGGKRTVTGQWETGADTLDRLAEDGHGIAEMIVAWRQVAKLKSTYSDALQVHANKVTHRVHTSYEQASVLTGRLSSADPNLQNVPVRTEDGRKIRTAFVTLPGRKLISADYSQIELRVLAHMANVPELRQAFADGVDIHALTASEMFGVPIEGMDPMVRRNAKAINFGIVYGISAFGLAAQLSIPREDAGAYIRRYFERFPGIKSFITATTEQVNDQGYVSTLFGREIHYPQIRFAKGNDKAMIERAAVNAPIQGTAADIIRRAMSKVEAELSQSELDAEMLLQVHDELIFDVLERDVAATEKLVVSLMENTHKGYVDISVPLTVEANAADNWQQAH